MNIADIINRNVASRERQQDFSVQMIDYRRLRPSKNNTYSTGQIRELADMILLSGGVKQNLLVRRVDADNYEIVAGHRRMLAVKMIVEDDGLEKYAAVPCKIESIEDRLAEFNLIVTNSTQRERSDAEKLHEAARLRKLIPDLIGDEKIKGRVLRKLVAQTMNTSETKVAQLDAINHNLIPQAREKLEAGELNVSAAYEISGLPKEQQETLMQQDNIRVSDVKKVKELGKKTGSEIDTKMPVNPVNDKISEDFEEQKEKVNICQSIEGNLNPPELQKEQQGPKTHRVKIAAMNYRDVCYGVKSFELCKNDRDYKVGDTLEMSEYKDGNPTGNIVRARIIYMLENYTGLKAGYCILGLDVMDYDIREDME